jgi:hypothetical protein
MKSLLLLCAMLLPLVSQARSFTLVDQETKETFVCTNDGSTPSPGTCVADVARVCNSTSNWTSGTCYNSAVENCKGRAQSYGTCVKSTYDTCLATGNWTAGTCYNSATGACK